MSIEAWSPDGKRAPDGTPGELVCTKAFPCMPVKFWNDPDNSKYRESYFDTFEGVWRHGDFVRFISPSRSIEMLGRSDGILNPAGKQTSGTPQESTDGGIKASDSVHRRSTACSFGIFLMKLKTPFALGRNCQTQTNMSYCSSDYTTDRSFQRHW